MYPNLLISDINEQYNLTVDNAASQDNTLTVMLVFAIIGMPARAALHVERLLLLPRQDAAGSGQLLTVGGRPSEAHMSQNGTRSVESRLIEYNRRAKIERSVAILLAFLAAAAVVGFVFVLSQIIARVFIESQTLSDVVPLLLLLTVLALVRGSLLWSSEVVAQRAANRVKEALATDVLDHIARLGPAYIQREQSGELVHSVTQGVEDLDEYVTSYQPLRALAVLVPVLVAAVILTIDPWTVVILVVTGPLLVLFLALIGGRAREIAERRSLELSWMSASFVDLLHGLATLKLFGRSQEQTENIREISKRYSSTTMQVLRTAFETSFVLELGASLATALVAVEIGIRLVAGDISFASALAVLIITPEFFLPIRQLSLSTTLARRGRRRPRACSPSSIPHFPSANVRRPRLLRHRPWGTSDWSMLCSAMTRTALRHSPVSRWTFQQDV